MPFIRRFDAVDRLRQEPLFRNHLLPDITAPFKARPGSGDVFPAVRVGRIDFYHKGGKLFSFDEKKVFRTHHKYASVIRKPSRRDYVADDDLHAIGSFAEGYDRIKENCALYSGPEAHGVAEIYSRFSCAKAKPTGKVVVLDIEVSLARDGDGNDPAPGETGRRRMDRIDLLLLDTTSGLLRFFEAKHFTNGELRAKPGNDPKIVTQMARYRKQMASVEVQRDIVRAYKKHVQILNDLLAPHILLPDPLKVDPEPRLLVFGFDKEQQPKVRQELGRLKTIRSYSIGSIKGANPDTIFRCGRGS